MKAWKNDTEDTLSSRQRERDKGGSGNREETNGGTQRSEN